jgi:hypothetical protein
MDPEEGIVYTSNEEWSELENLTNSDPYKEYISLPDEERSDPIDSSDSITVPRTKEE